MGDFGASFDRREGESLESFSRRLVLLRRLEPFLGALAERGIQVVVESARAVVGDDGLEADFIVEFGDLRIRLLAIPGAQSLADLTDVTDRAYGYLLSVPDTDAIALVLDDDELSTILVDVYATSGPARELPEPAPFNSAIAHYFTANALAVEIPDFRSLIDPPTVKDLEVRLAKALTDTFNDVVGSRARIPEKINALESLGSSDLARLIRIGSKALRGASVDANDVLDTGRT